MDFFFYQITAENTNPDNSLRSTLSKLSNQTSNIHCSVVVCALWWKFIDFHPSNACHDWAWGCLWELSSDWEHHKGWMIIHKQQQLLKHAFSFTSTHAALSLITVDFQNNRACRPDTLSFRRRVCGPVGTGRGSRAAMLLKRVVHCRGCYNKKKHSREAKM